MPDDREQFRRKQLQDLRSQFRAKYGPLLTEEERRMLDHAEQLLSAEPAKKKAAGEK